jgi:hypothetical protein
VQATTAQRDGDDDDDDDDDDEALAIARARSIDKGFEQMFVQWFRR